jgi:hypothetical protein
MNAEEFARTVMGLHHTVPVQHNRYDKAQRFLPLKPVTKQQYRALFVYATMLAF